MADESGELQDQLRRLAAGDQQALAELFARYRDRLRRMVKLRLDRRLQGRVDASDVLQDAYLDVAQRAAEYAASPTLPVFLWLRFLTGMKLHALHRHHLGTKARAAGREVPLHGALPRASSVSLAARLLGRLTTPSQAAVRAELWARVREALNGLEALDREVLALRHFEQLTNAETAQVLGLSETAASNRYVRALQRLTAALQGTPGPGGAAPAEGAP